MTRLIDSLFTPEELAAISQDETVLQNLGKISANCHKVRFSVDLSESVRSKLASIGLSTHDSIPMTWISEDIGEHIDSGPGDFKETILVYVSDTEGSIIIGGESYDIVKGRAFTFENGLAHHTENTGSVPRLLIGPMSETGIPVGQRGIYYFYDENDEINMNIGNAAYIDYQDPMASSSISRSATFPNNVSISPPFVGAVVLSWAGQTDSGSGLVPITYNSGDTWVNIGYDVFLYPIWGTERIMCFGEDTPILCLDPENNETEKYITVKDLRRGVLVKTLSSGYQPISLIGYSKIYNSANNLRGKNRLYRCSQNKYPEMIGDIIITGCHSILTTSLTDQQRLDTEEMVGRIFVTENRYRLMACIDERAQPYEQEGVFPIWHFALEHEHIRANYGVYANGLLVETSSKRMMSEYSGLELI
jgi:hypothetical protein